MRNERKIRAHKRSLLSWLKDLEKINKQLAVEDKVKKIEKLNKKKEFCCGGVETAVQTIGKAGGTMEEILCELNDWQRQIVLECVPYGLKVDMTKEDKKRIFEIELCKDWIRDIKKAEAEGPAYDPNLSVKERKKYKLYKKEVRLGNRLYGSSQPKFEGLYDPEFNYLEHMRYAKEFTDEEKAIMERCYLIAEEYDRSTDTIHGKIHLAQAKIWVSKDLKNICPDMVKQFNPDRDFAPEELKYEAKELYKRLLEFMINEEIHKPYVNRWTEINQESSLEEQSAECKENYTLDVMAEEFGPEIATFTYFLIGNTESTWKAIRQINQYSYEELGLK